MAENVIAPVERIEQAILLIRGHKVMLDMDLAALYEVPTKALNQAVRRNADRFPPDFMFRLTAEDVDEMRSQFVTASGEACGTGQRRDHARLRPDAANPCRPRRPRPQACCAGKEVRYPVQGGVRRYPRTNEAAACAAQAEGPNRISRAGSGGYMSRTSPASWKSPNSARIERPGYRGRSRRYSPTAPAGAQCPPRCVPGTWESHRAGIEHAQSPNDHSWLITRGVPSLHAASKPLRRAALTVGEGSAPWGAPKNSNWFVPPPALSPNTKAQLRKS